MKEAQSLPCSLSCTPVSCASLIRLSMIFSFPPFYFLTSYLLPAFPALPAPGSVLSAPNPVLSALLIISIRCFLSLIAPALIVFLIFQYDSRVIFVLCSVRSLRNNLTFFIQTFLPHLLPDRFPSFLPAPFLIPFLFCFSTLRNLPLLTPFTERTFIAPSLISERTSSFVMASFTSASFSGFIQTLFSPTFRILAAILLWSFIFSSPRIFLYSLYPYCPSFLLLLVLLPLLI